MSTLNLYTYCLAAALLFAAPLWQEAALAEPAPSFSQRAFSAEPLPRDPLISAGLALGAPLGMLALGHTLPIHVDPYYDPFLKSTPMLLGFGAGHLYAGDPGRGLLVNLGAPVVAFGSAMLLHSLLGSRGGNGGGGPLAIELMTSGITLAYWGWGAVDAYQTTERKNQERAGLKGPLLVP